MILTEVTVKAEDVSIIPMTNQFQILSLVEVYASRGNEGSCAVSGTADNVWFCKGNTTVNSNPGRKPLLVRWFIKLYKQ